MPNFKIQMVLRNDNKLNLVQLIINNRIKLKKTSGLPFSDLQKATKIMLKKIKFIKEHLVFISICSKNKDYIGGIKDSKLLTLRDLFFANLLFRKELSILEKFSNIKIEEIEEIEDSVITIELLTVALNLTLKRIKVLEDLIKID